MTRIAIQPALACLAVAAALGADGAAAAVGPARSADEFVDSVGVNVHLHYQGSVYDTAFDSVIKPKLVASGIRHVRDGAATHAAAGYDFFYYQRCRELAAEGIRFNLLTGFATAYHEATDYGRLEDVYAWCAGAVESFEGVNEADVQPLPAGAPDWQSQTIASQVALYGTVRWSERIGHVPVIGPTVVHRPDAIGDLSGHLDYGNWHPYPGGECPTCGDVYGHDVDFYLPWYRAPSGYQPMIMSETGYHNAVHTLSGHRPASERAAGRYMPRLLLEFFNRGFARTYLYELADLWDDPARETPDANFGLLRNDGSEKPAYRAVKSLLGLLSDPGPWFWPGALDFHLGGDLDRVHHTLLQKRDGTFFLALWLERSSYDTGARPHAPDDVAARADVPARVQPVTIALAEAPAAVTIHRLTDSGALSSRAADAPGGEIRLPVTDRVTLVELQRWGEPGSRAGRALSSRNRPRLSQVRLSRRVLRPAEGTRLHYRLSRRATVSVAVVRRGAARPLVRMRSHRRGGKHSTRLPSRVRGRALTRGRYRVRVRASNSVGAGSAARVVGFRVQGRPRGAR